MAVALETKIAQINVDRVIQGRRADITRIEEEVLRLKIEHNIEPSIGKRTHPYRQAVRSLIDQRRELQSKQRLSRAQARALQIANYFKYQKKGD